MHNYLRSSQHNEVKSCRGLEESRRALKEGEGWGNK